MKSGVFSLLLVLFLLANKTLFAVGGKGTTEVSEEEKHCKGVVKLFTPGESIFTGVLFDKGVGRIGISAKHCFLDFDKQNIFAQFGKETRKVIKVFSNKTSDIALFIVDEPFTTLPQLPPIPDQHPKEPSQTTTLYGYGNTGVNAVINFDSKRCCRRNTFNCSLVTNLSPDCHKSISNELLNGDFSIQCDIPNLMISVADFGIEKLDPPTLQMICNIKKKQDKEELKQGEINTLSRETVRQDLMKHRGLPLIEGVVPFSNGISFPGDSGGPIFDKENNLLGIYVKYMRNLMANKLIITSTPPKINEDCIRDDSVSTVNIENEPYMVSMFIHKIHGVIICVQKIVSVDHETKMKKIDETGRTQYLDIQPFNEGEEQSVINLFKQFFTKELKECFTKGGDKDNVFRRRLKLERELPENDKWLTHLCSQFCPWNYDFFVSTIALKDWIGRATDAAFEFIEKKKAKKQ